MPTTTVSKLWEHDGSASAFGLDNVNGGTPPVQVTLTDTLGSNASGKACGEEEDPCQPDIIIRFTNGPEMDVQGHH